MIYKSYQFRQIHGDRLRISAHIQKLHHIGGRIGDGTHNGAAHIHGNRLRASAHIQKPHPAGRIGSDGTQRGDASTPGGLSDGTQRAAHIHGAGGLETAHTTAAHIQKLHHIGGRIGDGTHNGAAHIHGNRLRASAHIQKPHPAGRIGSDGTQRAAHIHGAGGLETAHTTGRYTSTAIA